MTQHPQLYPTHRQPADLVPEILRRLEERTGAVPFDTLARVWRASCPVPSEPHFAFVVKYRDARPEPGFDLFCQRHTEHSTAMLLTALGLNPFAVTRGPVREVPTWP